MRATFIAASISLLCVVACGGGGSKISGGDTPGGGGSGSNVQSITVDSGPPDVANSNSPAVNTAYTTVTVCAPGSTGNCQTIGHIQVDTGSSGLRILSSALTITLPSAKDTGGNVIAECTGFVDGSSWGPLAMADVKIAGETASNQAIQIIGVKAYSSIPADCPSANPENTVQDFGANGILGVGFFISDCGPRCEVQGHGVYFTCPTPSTCADSALPQAQQVSNPVAAFATDNNGVIIQLPTVSSTGERSVSGQLIFGIGTQSNNGLGNAQVYMVNASNGSFTTNYTGGPLTDSFMDSGSNAFYFPDQNINVCGSDGKPSNAKGFFCPPTTLNLTATITDSNSKTSPTLNFSVANAETLFSSSTLIAAASNLAASSLQLDNASSSFNGGAVFDFGLPFYFGRSVYTGIEGRNSAAGVGPYLAF